MRRVTQAIELISGSASFTEALDRMLDKGIVIDAWVRLAASGVDLSTMGPLAVSTVTGYSELAAEHDDPEHPPPISAVMRFRGLQ